MVDQQVGKDNGKKHGKIINNKNSLKKKITAVLFEHNLQTSKCLTYLPHLY